MSIEHLPWIIPQWQAPPSVKAVCTTRTDDLKNPSCQNFNLATTVEDNPSTILKNRALLKNILELSSEPAWLTQTHSNKAIYANTNMPLTEADASFTNQQNVACVVLTADCLPILLCNKKGTQVAAIHAGWRGLENGIITETVRSLQEPGDQLLAWLGPAIGPEKFQVGSDVREQFIAQNSDNAAAFKPDTEGKWLANIFMLATIQLNQLNIFNITSSNLCTVTDEKRFFSYRREGKTGRMASLIWLAAT